MRILQVSAGIPPEGQGGAERFCFGLSMWLNSASAEVQIAAPSRRTHGNGHPIRPLRKAESKYLRKLFFDYFSPLNVRRLERIIDEFRPDIVHGHNIYGISSQLLHVASRRVPTVVTLHDYWPIDFFGPTVVGGRLRYPRRQALLAPWVRLHQAIHRRHLRRVTLVSPSRYLAQPDLDRRRPDPRSPPAEPPLPPAEEGPPAGAPFGPDGPGAGGAGAGDED